MRRVAVILAVLLVAASCGEDSSSEQADPTSTTATTTIATTTTAQPAKLDYDVERATRFIGSPEPQRTFFDPQSDGDTENWFHPWGPWPQGEGWTLVLSRRMQGGSWDADLLMVIDDSTGTVTDALLFTGESIGDAVTIGLSCEGTKPAVLVDQDQVAVRTWKVTSDSLSLVEVDVTELTEAEIGSACLNTLNPRPGDEPIPDYVVEVPVEYIGQELDGPPEGGSWASVTTESRSERYEAGFRDLPRVALMGDLVLAGQLPHPAGGAFPMQVTDGVRLISDSANVWLRIQCPRQRWGIEGEGVGAVAVMWVSDGSARALQLWDYDPDQSRLVELDPATYEVGGCISDSRGRGS